ncbi:hypothetical protein T265_03390 [Opisthorchis viverrini]|uniref:Uncharacterized protein n=1 Tax=Opisthorchis viverrini TaxID=6198 RepID=A0A075AHM2_OPIVI|nr:hypothetical protein T265_03390 [Opisthorchis viverrini]KER30129.1 hypothetical protein T265_03390 [Opisthorchis viverrini]
MENGVGWKRDSSGPTVMDGGPYMMFENQLRKKQKTGWLSAKNERAPNTLDRIMQRTGTRALNQISQQKKVDAL